MIIALFVSALGLAGLVLASHIRFKKKKGAPLVCPIGSNCNVVIHSEYSRFLGIPVEILGILYYALIFLTYASLALFPALDLNLVEVGLLLASASAFLFSIYLTFLQLFKIKEICVWCLFSASISSVIFILSYVKNKEALLFL